MIRVEINILRFVVCASVVKDANSLELVGGAFFSIFQLLPKPFENPIFGTLASNYM